jgi:hypothetical protein
MITTIVIVIVGAILLLFFLLGGKSLIVAAIASYKDVKHRRAVEQEGPDAMYELGLQYALEEKEGKRNNSYAAIEMFRKAAEQGHDEAYAALAEYGIYDVTLTQAETDELFRAAQQGDVEARYDLGLMYLHGDSVSQSAVMAMSYFRQAAEQGHADAQFYLGKMYLEGVGINQSDEQAARWFHKAAEQGHDEARAALGLVADV